MYGNGHYNQRPPGGGYGGYHGRRGSTRLGRRAQFIMYPPGMYPPGMFPPGVPVVRHRVGRRRAITGRRRRVPP